MSLSNRDKIALTPVFVYKVLVGQRRAGKSYLYKWF